MGLRDDVGSPCENTWTGKHTENCGHNMTEYKCRICGEYKDDRIIHGLTAEECEKQMQEDNRHCMQPDEHHAFVPLIEYIKIIVTSNDIDYIADEFGIDRELAGQRMEEWGRHIESTMSGYAMEQVTDVIRSGQP